MRRPAALIPVALFTLALTSCGSDEEPAATAASPSTSSPAASGAPTSRTAAPSSSPAATSSTATSSPSSSAAPGPGTEVTTAFGSVTYFGQRTGAAPDAPPPAAAGTEWLAIDVQLCLNSSSAGGTVRSSSWVVRDAGNGLTDPCGVTYDQFPAPQYPVEAPLDSGCVRGWVTYPIVTGKPLTQIQYTSESQPDPITWTA